MKDFHSFIYKDKLLLKRSAIYVNLSGKIKLEIIMKLIKSGDFP